MATNADVTKRKHHAMTEWARVLTKNAHDALERMDTTLTLAEAKVALVRELVAQRQREAVESVCAYGNQLGEHHGTQGTRVG